MLLSMGLLGDELAGDWLSSNFESFVRRPGVDGLGDMSRQRESRQLKASRSGPEFIDLGASVGRSPGVTEKVCVVSQ